MLTCREVTEEASAFLDREQGLFAAAKFRLHLMLCRHCRRYVDQLAETIALLRTSRETSMDPVAEDALITMFHERK
ncbi:putative anti-sigma-YlaC factor YlaD [Rhodoligotrophos appendicifer]|uniref:anti-sigma factor family protein n=1 Tax=Rhodoligotrophos appendicifer TaxID=987056 RepID=UPI00118529BF|nr:zf-HC2 domain-containing protein [Rhodoligotrophos appendicifer]